MTTFVLSLILMAGLFLMLWAEVGFIQEKRFASSAPKEELAVIPESMPQRFRGQHAVGYAMALLSVVLMGGAVVYGAWDGVRSGFTFGQFFVRFLAMILLLKAFDIGFFDWVLLCNQGFNFFPHYYPMVRDVLGPHLFGYNWKTHLSHIIASFPLSALLAWICTLF